MPGFLAYYRNVIQPLVEPAATDSAAINQHHQDVFVLQRLLDHLYSYSSYYTEAFLQYVSDITNGRAVIDFGLAQFDSLVFADPAFALDPNDFDFDRTFIAQRGVVIPGMGVLDKTALAAIGPFITGVKDLEEVVPPVSSVEEIEVPCDGIYLEVAEGLCRLGEPPHVDSGLPGTLTGVTIGLPPPS